MNKKEFIHCVTKELRDRNIRKNIRPTKYTFTITDEDGASKNFTIKKKERKLLFTEEDITKIIDTSLDVILNGLRNGDNIAIHGFGTLGLKYRKPRLVKNVETGEPTPIAGHYVPKLSAGKQLSLSARLYELSGREQFDKETGGDDSVI